MLQLKKSAAPSQQTGAQILSSTQGDTAYRDLMGGTNTQESILSNCNIKELLNAVKNVDFANSVLSKDVLKKLRNKHVPVYNTRERTEK